MTTETNPNPPAPSEADSRALENTAEPTDATSHEGDAAVDAGKIAGKRVRIGSQRPGSKRVTAKPQYMVQTVTDSRLPVKTADVPNLRQRLSDEDEAAIASAMDGLSIEEAIAPAAVKGIEPDTRLPAKVVGVHRDTVFVDLGDGRQGAVPLRQFRELPTIGTAFEVTVSQFDAEEGLYLATLPGGAVDVADWSEIAEGMIVEATVTGMNKGGLECKVNNLRAFMPAAQVSDFRVEDLTQFFNQKLTCVVTDCDPEKRNLVLSHRAVLERQKEESRERLKAELEEGQVREGVVRSLQDFGAFVDLGGMDGLLHVSQLSWQRVNHPREVLQVGQRVKVKVRKIDAASGKISLSFRDLLDNPWDTMEQRVAPTTIVHGKVTRLMDFGAFVEIEPGIEGLVHVSELAHKRVVRVSDVVKVGDEVEAKVLAVDREKQRISLSIKAAQALAAASKADETVAENEEPVVPIEPHNLKLRGGMGRKRPENQFGLKW